jgi:hypothetical protein
LVIIFNIAGSDLAKAIKNIYQVSSICNGLLDEVQRVETGTMFSVGKRAEATSPIS